MQTTQNGKRSSVRGREWGKGLVGSVRAKGTERLPEDASPKWQARMPPRLRRRQHEIAQMQPQGVWNLEPPPVPRHAHASPRRSPEEPLFAAPRCSLVTARVVTGQCAWSQLPGARNSRASYFDSSAAVGRQGRADAAGERHCFPKPCWTGSVGGSALHRRPRRGRMGVGVGETRAGCNHPARDEPARRRPPSSQHPSIAPPIGWGSKTCERSPPWSQPRSNLTVSLVNSSTNSTRIVWHLGKIDLGFAPGLPPGSREVPKGCRKLAKGGEGAFVTGLAPATRRSSKGPFQVSTVGPPWALLTDPASCVVPRQAARAWGRLLILRRCSDQGFWLRRCGGQARWPRND